MRLVDHVYDDQVIDHLTVKIILPEGARSVCVPLSLHASVPLSPSADTPPPSLRNIHLDTPYPIDRMPDQLHYTYLDTFGRPVLVATKKNLVEQHIQDVVVSKGRRRGFLSDGFARITVRKYVLYSCSAVAA